MPVRLLDSRTRRSRFVIESRSAGREPAKSLFVKSRVVRLQASAMKEAPIALLRFPDNCNWFAWEVQAPKVMATTANNYLHPNLV